MHEILLFVYLFFGAIDIKKHLTFTTKFKLLRELFLNEIYYESFNKNEKALTEINRTNFFKSFL